MNSLALIKPVPSALGWVARVKSKLPLFAVCLLVMGLALSDLSLAATAAAGTRVPHIPYRAAPEVRDIALGEEAEWGYGSSLFFRAGNLGIYVRKIPTPEGNNHYAASIARRGRAPVHLMFDASEAGCCTLIVDRLDRSGARYVMLRGYTGGLHCCSEQYVIAPDARHPRVNLLGDFDAAPSSVEETRDIDGDGRIDFLRNDSAFDYAFAGYQASEMPPQVWNLIDGRLVDVSSTLPFRAIFVRFMAGERETCLQGEPMVRDAACAAYVAAAARIGEFVPAWRLMLGAYVRDDVFEGRTFPQRLRSFLMAHRYISRRQRIPPAIT